MNKPPLGICLPVTYDHCRDGDTPVVKLRTGQKIAVRLIGIDTPEVGAPGAAEATTALETILSQAKDIVLWVPLPDVGKDGVVDVFDVLRSFSFDRVPGRLFADDKDVTELMLEAKSVLPD